MSPVSRLFDRRHRAVGIVVARTGAVPQFRDGIFRCLRLFILIMRARFEIVGMTTGAVRFVGRARPGRRLRVALMAIDARNVRTVVTGISGRRMGETDGRPPRCRMALIALQ